MKKWNTPAIAELDIEATANGIFDIDWEGPFNFIFGDKADGDSSTPETEDVVNPLS